MDEMRSFLSRPDWGQIETAVLGVGFARSVIHSLHQFFFPDLAIFLVKPLRGQSKESDLTMRQTGR